jgi:hypothetical protein
MKNSHALIHSQYVLLSLHSVHSIAMLPLLDLVHFIHLLKSPVMVRSHYFVAILSDDSLAYSEISHLMVHFYALILSHQIWFTLQLSVLSIRMVRFNVLNLDSHFLASFITLIQYYFIIHFWYYNAGLSSSASLNTS